MAKRGRPKGSKTKNGAAPPAPGSQPGHNELSEEERQRRFVIGLTEIEGHEEARASAKAKADNERKRLMAFGFTKGQIDFALKLRRSTPEEAVDDWRKMQQAARFINHPIGTQPDMFGEAGAARSEVDEAIAEGGIAGLEGKPCTPPYDASSPKGQGWIEGWHKGSAERTQHFQTAVSQDAGAAAAEDFDDSVEADEPDNEPDDEGQGGNGEASEQRPYHETLRDQNRAVDEKQRQLAQGADKA